MKTLYLECAMGAAGDMLMGALYELYPEKEQFLHTMNHLFPGLTVAAESVRRQGIAGTHMRVVIDGQEEGHGGLVHAIGQEHSHEAHDHTHEHDHHHEHTHDHAHGHEHHHHTPGHIRHLIQELPLPQPVRDQAEAVYGLLAQAESRAHGVPVEEVTPLQRRHAKAVNFGIVYGISEFSLAEDIGVSRYEARAYIDNYLNNYRGVKEYMHKVVADAREIGYTETLYGRRRYIPELKSSNFNVRSGAERIALNTPIQGTAADLIKLAMIRVENALNEKYPDAQLLLQVHDELIVECPEGIAQEVAALVSREMENVASLSVPLTAEAKFGKSWYEAK